MSDLLHAPAPDGESSSLRVMTNDTPLGSVRLTMRAIAEAEGYVLCRHGALPPVVVREQEWRAMPLATKDNFDI